MIKEKFRSKIIIDEYDFLILKNLVDTTDNLTKIAVRLETLKKIFGLSNRAISLHLKRLKSHYLIFELKREKENWKYKHLTLTNQGHKILKELLKSPQLKTRFNK